MEKISERDLGQMYIFQNDVLIVRSSASILLFKLEEDEYTQNKNWKQYTQLELKG